MLAHFGLVRLRFPRIALFSAVFHTFVLSDGEKSSRPLAGRSRGGMPRSIGGESRQWRIATVENRGSGELRQRRIGAEESS